jgi:hypothetical protein
VMLCAAGFAVRPHPARRGTRAAERTLTRLAAVARSGNSSLFLETARMALTQALAERWQLSAAQINSTELKTRLGSTGEEIDRLFALADEAKYSPKRSQAADFQHWLGLVRSQLIPEAG